MSIYSKKSHPGKLEKALYRDLKIVVLFLSELIAKSVARQYYVGIRYHLVEGDVPF